MNLFSCLSNEVIPRFATYFTSIAWMTEVETVQLCCRVKIDGEENNQGCKSKKES